VSATNSTPRRTRVKRNPGIWLSSAGKYEFNYRDSEGKLRWKTVDGDLAAARAERAGIIARKATGERVVPAKFTFKEYAETWFQGLTLRPGTIAVYRNAYKQQLDPEFGKKRLAEIKPGDVARLVAKMTRDGYSPYTIRGTLSPLGRIMNSAVRDGLIPANPVRALDKSERPPASNGERRSLDEKELKRLLAKAGKKWRPLLAVGAFAGLRIGEALGLQWQDIDFKNNLIHVRRTLGRDKRPTEPKTERSKRSVILIPELAAVLKEHRIASPFKAPGDYVFAAPDRKGRDHRSTARVVQRIAENAGLEDVTYHTLRHCFASLLITGAKQDVETVSRQLGHASSAITLTVYSHEFGKERSTAQVRDALSSGFGHLLRTG
jgi:integrase